MLRYMLDTNICVYATSARTFPVRTRLNRHAEQSCVSSVTYMELYYGAEYSSDPHRARRGLDEFAAPLTLLDYDRDAAAHTGEIRAHLRRKGTPIGPYDSMIAGHARSKGLALVTNNLAEFSRVPGLQCENWID
ncbi:MAG: tRNA(fMet)-specific endonuclease VapC [Parvularculaceae bacterium]